MEKGPSSSVLQAVESLGDNNGPETARDVGSTLRVPGAGLPVLWSREPLLFFTWLELPPPPIGLLTAENAVFPCSPSCSDLEGSLGCWKVGMKCLYLILLARIYFPSSENTPTLPENPPLLLISVLVVPSVTLSWPQGGPVSQSWPTGRTLLINWSSAELQGH